MTTGKNMVEID